MLKSLAKEERRRPDVLNEQEGELTEKERGTGAAEREEVAEVQRRKAVRREPVTDEKSPRTNKRLLVLFHKYIKNW